MKTTQKNYTEKELEDSILGLSKQIYPSTELFRRTLDKLPELVSTPDFVPLKPQHPILSPFAFSRSFGFRASFAFVALCLVVVGISGFQNSKISPTSVSPSDLSTTLTSDDSDAALAQDSQVIDDELNALDVDEGAIGQGPGVAEST